MRRYTWLATSRPIRHLLLAWCACYAGDLAAVTGNPESVESVGQVVSTWLESG